MDCIKRDIIDYIEKELSPKRLKHTYGVAEEAGRLAERYGANVEKAKLAALFHDMCKSMPVSELDRYVEECGLSKNLKGRPDLSHGKVAAQLMERDYGIKDEELINAVSFHTTGRAGMSMLEKIVFLADAIEPSRDYPGVDDIRKLAYEDIDRACVRSLSRTVDYIKQKGGYLDPDTEDALRDLEEKENL